MREGERGGEGEFRNVYTCTCKCIYTHIQQADIHTHCVPIIMYCTPTLREISVTMRADKVFLMPAQVLGSDIRLQRERETERVATNRNIHTVSMNWLYVIGVCVCVCMCMYMLHFTACSRLNSTKLNHKLYIYIHLCVHTHKCQTISISMLCV